MKCTAKNRNGQSCGRHALLGKEHCHAHGGKQVGRPSKLTDEVIKKICDALRAGNYLSVAVAYAGISRATFYRWMAAGERDDADPQLRRLVEEVAKAEADAEVHSVGLIRRSAVQGDWRAALALLERRYPDRWARRSAPPQTRPKTDADEGQLDTNDPDTRAILDELLRRRQTRR